LEPTIEGKGKKVHLEEEKEVEGGAYTSEKTPAKRNGNTNWNVKCGR